MRPKFGHTMSREFAWSTIVRIFVDEIIAKLSKMFFNNYWFFFSYYGEWFLKFLLVGNHLSINKIRKYEFTRNYIKCMSESWFALSIPFFAM